jgi:hypothetical protein
MNYKWEINWKVSRGTGRALIAEQTRHLSTGWTDNVSPTFRRTVHVTHDHFIRGYIFVSAVAINPLYMTHWLTFFGKKRPGKVSDLANFQIVSSLSITTEASNFVSFRARRLTRLPRWRLRNLDTWQRHLRLRDIRILCSHRRKPRNINISTCHFQNQWNLEVRLHSLSTLANNTD